MTERLIIRNFAGLEEVDIELGRINIFIGPQASGKSVCAKCLYWFKSFLPDFLFSASKGNDWKSFEKIFLNRFKEYFPGIWQTDELLFLRYEVEGRFIELTNTDSKLHLRYDDLFRRATYDIIGGIAALKEKYAQPEIKWRTLSSQFELSYEENILLDKIKGPLHEEVGDMLDTKQLFILAGRSFFAALKGAFLSFLANSPVIDPFLRSFISNYELQRRYQPKADIPRIQALWKLAQHILKGNLIIEGEDDFIVAENGRKVKLANASSGQQEAFALVLVLINLVSNEDTPDQGPYTVYVEEPEAHLFPESQRAMAQLMANVYHESVFSLQYVITTHSPYLLASFNNLIYAHQLAQTLHDQPAKLKALYKVVPKNQQLALADVRVYGFENGTVKPLIDTETGLLSADLLDSASDVTADQFGTLMALDPAIHS